MERWRDVVEDELGDEVKEERCYCPTANSKSGVKKPLSR